MDNSVRFRWRGSGEITSADLLRQCGQKLGDRELWTMFEQRFRDLIYLYVLRALRFHSKKDDVHELVADLGQEVCVRLVRNNGSMLRGFRGESDLSVAAFLARVSLSVVADHLRRDESFKRRSNVVSLEEAKEVIEHSRQPNDELNVGAMLTWIDVEKLVAKETDQKNAQRNAIIFKLHFMDGLTAEEIACFPGFDLTPSGVEGVIKRLRKRIKQ